MSFVINNAIPVSVSPRFIYATALAQFNQFDIHLAPMTASGGLFDMTPATTVTFEFDNGQPLGSPGYLVKAEQGSIGSAGPTGCTVSLTGFVVHDALTPLQAGGVSAGRVTISLNDGTTSVIAGVGTWSVVTYP